MTKDLRRKHLIRGLATICALAVSFVLAPALSGTAHADKVYGYKISRSEVIARAHYWLAANVQYSQTKYYQDPEGTGPSNGGYRTDCSGFISMAWHLKDQRWTGNLADVATKISKSSMKPGDMLLNESGGHVALFEKWVDKSAGKFRVIEQANSADDMRNGYGYTGSGRFASSSYSAYKYKKIFDDEYSAGNETSKQSESGAKCNTTSLSDSTIDLPNRRDVYIHVRSCIKRIRNGSSATTWKYHAWITLSWEPGKDSDDSSNTSKKRFDGLMVHTQIQQGHTTKREVRCHLYNNINASYYGSRSCNTTFYSANDNLQVDGFLNWDRDGDGERWQKPIYAYGKTY